MKCPFELPVRKSKHPDKNGLFRIRAASNMPLIGNLTSDEADYIAQAINSHEKLAEKHYKDYKRLWELADKDNCDGDCDLEPPHNRCAECLARSALNDLGEMRGQLMDEIEHALEEAEKTK